MSRRAPPGGSKLVPPDLSSPPAPLATENPAGHAFDSAFDFLQSLYNNLHAVLKDLLTPRVRDPLATALQKLYDHLQKMTPFNRLPGNSIESYIEHIAVAQKLYQECQSCIQEVENKYYKKLMRLPDFRFYKEHELNLLSAVEGRLGMMRETLASNREAREQKLNLILTNIQTVLRTHLEKLTHKSEAIYAAVHLEDEDLPADSNFIQEIRFARNILKVIDQYKQNFISMRDAFEQIKKLCTDPEILRHYKNTDTCLRLIRPLIGPGFDELIAESFTEVKHPSYLHRTNNLEVIPHSQYEQYLRVALESIRESAKKYTDDPERQKNKEKNAYEHARKILGICNEVLESASENQAERYERALRAVRTIYYQEALRSANKKEDANTSQLYKDLKENFYEIYLDAGYARLPPRADLTKPDHAPDFLNDLDRALGILKQESGKVPLALGGRNTSKHPNPLTKEALLERRRAALETIPEGEPEPTFDTKNELNRVLKLLLADVRDRTDAPLVLAKLRQLEEYSDTPLADQPQILIDIATAIINQPGLTQESDLFFLARDLMKNLIEKVIPFIGRAVADKPRTEPDGDYQRWQAFSATAQENYKAFQAIARSIPSAPPAVIATEDTATLPTAEVQSRSHALDPMDSGALFAVNLAELRTRTRAITKEMHAYLSLLFQHYVEGKPPHSLIDQESFEQSQAAMRRAMDRFSIKRSLLRTADLCTSAVLLSELWADAQAAKKMAEAFFVSALPPDPKSTLDKTLAKESTRDKINFETLGARLEKIDKEYQEKISAPLTDSSKLHEDIPTQIESVKAKIEASILSVEENLRKNVRYKKDYDDLGSNSKYADLVGDIRLAASLCFSEPSLTDNASRLKQSLSDLTDRIRQHQKYIENHWSEEILPSSFNELVEEIRALKADVFKLEIIEKETNRRAAEMRSAEVSGATAALAAEKNAERIAKEKARTDPEARRDHDEPARKAALAAVEKHSSELNRLRKGAVVNEAVIPTWAHRDHGHAPPPRPPPLQRGESRVQIDKAPSRGSTPRSAQEMAPLGKPRGS